MTPPATLPPTDNSVRLNRHDWRLIGIAIAATLVSLWVATHYFHRAFPEAAIDFRVSSAQSGTLARQFLQARGLNPAGYQHAVQFDYDDDTATFLERELGLDRAQALLDKRIRLWRWDNRWFQPLVKQEFQIGVTPSGQVASFDHEIADDAPGANLDLAQAQALAQHFLTDVMHIDPAGLAFVGQQRTVRAHRTDYLFLWRETAPLEPNASGYVAQAQYRHVVLVQGGEIGAYDEYLQIPEQWSRDYERLRSKNDTAGDIDTGLMLALLLVGMLVTLAQKIGRGDVRWRPALWVGGAGFVLSFLNSLNEMPAARFSYDTTQSYGAFLSSTLLHALLSAAGTAVLLGLLTAAGEALYRERFGRQIALDCWLTRSGVRSKGFLISMVLGLTLAAFFFAYQTVFYLIANHFGAWAPADIPYDEILNTHFPWIAVLLGGYFPAISEEFGFRMLAIPLFEKWFRWLWVAVVAASFLWGFGHALYPNEPFYIRGVEVGLGGILLSWIMIRFGILTTVVWHYTVDALYTAMLLLRAHSAYFRFTGGLTAFLAVAPLIAAVAAYKLGGRFASEGPLTNAAQGSAPAPAAAAAVAPAAAVRPQYQPVAARRWALGVVIAAALLAAFAVHLESWNAALPWKTSAPAAVDAARAFLAQQGIDTRGYRVAVEAGTPDQLSGGLGESDGIAAGDLFTLRGRGPLLAAFSGPPPTVPAVYWRVRFYRPLEELGYSVGVRTDFKSGSGVICGYAASVPEATPGASPPLDQARQTAAAFLAQRGVDVTGMQEKVARQEQRPARTDSDFVWEAATPLLPSGTAYRVEAELAGGTVELYHAWYHVPDARVRQVERSTLGSTLLAAAPWLFGALVVALIAWQCYRFARAEATHWRPLLQLAGVATAIALAYLINNLPQLFAAYDTTQPMGAFWTAAMVQIVAGCIGAFLVTLVLLAPVTMTAPAAAGLWSAEGWRRTAPAWAGDAAIAGLLSLGWCLGWGRAIAVIESAWHAAGQAPLPAAPALARYVAPLGDFLRALLLALWIAALLGLVVPAWDAARRGRMPWRALAAAALVLGWALALPSIHSGAQLALGAILAGMDIFLLLLFAALFLRNNPLAWFSAALVPLLAFAGFDWLGLGQARGPHYATIAGAALLVAAAAWLLWLWRLSRRAALAGAGAAV